MDYPNHRHPHHKLAGGTPGKLSSGLLYWPLLGSVNLMSCRCCRIAGKGTTMSDQTIKLGSTGEAVVKAQRELMLRYYLPPGSDDGTFGPITRNRALRYQLDRADHEYQSLSFPLDVDGVVGTKTWRGSHLLWSSGTTKGIRSGWPRRSSSITDAPRTTREPSTGSSAIRPRTAVTNFQRDHSEPDGRPLDVDGIVGPRTWRALWS